jgi:hypothetical protein
VGSPHGQKMSHAPSTRTVELLQSILLSILEQSSPALMPGYRRVREIIQFLLPTILLRSKDARKFCTLSKPHVLSRATCSSFTNLAKSGTKIILKSDLNSDWIESGNTHKAGNRLMCFPSLKLKKANDAHFMPRGVGQSKANLLKEKAKESIGLTEGLQIALKELAILLRRYNLYQEQLDLLMREIECLVGQIPGTPEMMSIPGVGLVTVAGFLAEIGDLANYDNPRQIQKMAGLNLRENSSGKHKGQTKITRRGSPRLRSLLFRGVITLLAKNAEFQELHRYYTQRSQNPLKKMQSAIALSCRLIRVLFALGRKQVPYDPAKVLGPVHMERLQNAA